MRRRAPLDVRPVKELVKVRRLVLQRSSQRLDEVVVEEAAPIVQQETHARTQHPVGEGMAGELGTLFHVEYLRSPPDQHVVQRIFAEQRVHRVRFTSATFSVYPYILPIMY